MKHPQLQLTADGSHTLFLPDLNEHYHSVNGAIQESLHVYINAGFNQCRKKTVLVLELGFGTGLNAFLTALEAEKQKVKVVYTALEKYPLTLEIIRQLNYSEQDSDLFNQIHALDWGKSVSLTSFFTLHKIKTDFRDYDYSGNYDVVYYDAFAPDKQPDVWPQELFDAIYASLHPEGIITTYCAKGMIRRRMKQSGFTVERIQGPPGKREMLRARK
jgi:tRNA U34 5-methylaminomethyl-2-thiouridine-forming methyltransferase MnmC